MEEIMDKKVVFISGASGSMGSQVLECVMRTHKFKGLILLRKKPANEKLAKKLAKKWGEELEIVFGRPDRHAGVLHQMERPTAHHGRAAGVYA